MSQSKIYNPPSILSLVKLFARIASATLFRALSYPFRSTRAPSLRKDVLNTAIRTLLTHITVPQSRYLNASTTQRYLSFCKAQKRRPTTIEVPYSNGKEKAVAHWIGDPDADVVILYFHGGAYFQPATSGTFLYLQHTITTLQKEKKGRSVAALVMAYTLAPEAAFPTQMQEGAAVLRWLFDEKGRSAASVFLGGDSAGGCIALSLLSHLLHPRQDVEKVVLPGTLGGALLFSPSVAQRGNFDSFRRNAGVDMLPAVRIPDWGAMYLGKMEELQGSVETVFSTDAYSEPVIAGEDWWLGLHQIVQNLLVMSGGDEVFADAISALGEDVKSGWLKGGGEKDRVVFVETPREAHIGPIVDFMMTRGKGVVSNSQRIVEEWWRARLSE
ncbi:hypothetical protein N0V90_012146 [Kalmusia sp. IMI 367209]|nr:hypothetical protein N0V90_012146 [Kalmusia sp. IMI 367209]